MKTSLIVTTYNNPSALEKVMEGIYCQTRKPDEVIIADDGSREETAALIRTFQPMGISRPLHVRHDDKGFRAAKIRNEAIKRSTGEYIILLDGDCVINRLFVSDHISLAEKGCFIQGKRILAGKDFLAADANSTVTLIRKALAGKISNAHHLIRLPRYFSIRNRKLKGIKSCNMSFFREDIEAVNGFNEDFVGWGNEDSELACRFFKYGLKKKVHPFMAICFHLWHPVNKTVTDENKGLLKRAITSREYVCKNGLQKNLAR